MIAAIAFAWHQLSAGPAERPAPEASVNSTLASAEDGSDDAAEAAPSPPVPRSAAATPVDVDGEAGRLVTARGSIPLTGRRMDVVQAIGSPTFEDFEDGALFLWYLDLGLISKLDDDGQIREHVIVLDAEDDDLQQALAQAAVGRGDLPPLQPAALAVGGRRVTTESDVRELGGDGRSLRLRLAQLRLHGRRGRLTSVSVKSFDAQDGTMGDIRTIATAMESYSIDANAYPVGRSITQLAPLLEPTYVKSVPSKDGWNRDYLVDSTPNDYVLASLGPDGVRSADDVAFETGSFTTTPSRWPGVDEAPAAEDTEQMVLMSLLDPRDRGSARGRAEFWWDGSMLRLEVTASGLVPGPHGIAIHERPTCASPGPHFNPAGTIHGGPDSREHHAGDLGNLLAGADGRAMLTMVLRDTSHSDLAMRAISIRERPDDLVTDPDGQAGPVIACGPIMPSPSGRGSVWDTRAKARTGGR